ncbi:MAG: hypothetical protein K8F25_17610, partial [Fimbriimonadaceae bacterium]|nr:hypothetical protein [Alphaproteobacteria bacterium]
MRSIFERDRGSVANNNAIDLQTIMAVALVLLIVSLPLVDGTGVRAQGLASVSESAGRPNAIFVDVPKDPCSALLNRMPPFYRNLTLQFGPVDLDTRKLFLLKCNEKKDELIATITGPIEEIRNQAQATVQTAVDVARNDLIGGFWKYVSEKLLAQLPASERAKYAPGSPETMALAHKWLNESPEEEFKTYVAAYYAHGGDAAFIYEAYKAYIDLTNGESKSILDAFNGVLERARERLGQVLNANRKAESSPPDTPSGDILESVGLSGRWVDNFKDYEGQIRDFDKNWKINEALTIMQGAFETDVPHEKVRTFFDLMETMSSLASDSNIPLVGLVGDIIGSYAQIANQTLDAVLALGEAIKKRHGFCLGLGVATDDPRSAYFSDQAILACPMALGTWPFKYIYEAQEKDSGKLFFYNGDSFTPDENGSGKDGILAALRLIDGAKDLGYAVTRDPKDHVAQLGEVYNTAHEGGIPGLFEEAERIVNSLHAVTERFSSFDQSGAACSPDQVLDSLQSLIGVPLENFQNEIKEHGTERLILTVAASFVAFEGRLGVGAGARSNAFQTYFEAEEKLADASMFVLDGRVLDQNRNPIAGAYLGVRISSGVEPRGCEAWRADEDGGFSVFAIGSTHQLAISISAETGDARSDEETFDLNYFRKTGRRFVSIDNSVFARAPGEIILQIDEEEAAQSNQPGPQPGAGTGENGGQESEPGPDLTELCALHEARLSDGLELLRSGQILEARINLFEMQNSPCEDIAARVANTLNDINAAVDEIIAAARRSAQQCDPTEIRAAAQSLDEKTYPEVAAVHTELNNVAGRIATAINTFESARNAYRAGNLAQARSGLEQSQQLFSQFAGFPDCSDYLARIETGFERIATLEQALRNAEAAIVSCDARLIGAYQNRFGELAGKHVSFAAKKSDLETAAGHIARVVQLIAAAEKNLYNGRGPDAAEKANRALTLLAGPLAGSNCSNLRALADAILSRQTASAPTDESNCGALAELREQALSQIAGGRFEAGRRTLRSARPMMSEPEMIAGCEG